jgi:hypothetical protein
MPFDNTHARSGWDVNTDPSGGLLLFAGEVVLVFPSVHAAWDWMTVAKYANAQLAACLAAKTTRGASQ